MARKRHRAPEVRGGAAARGAAGRSPALRAWKAVVEHDRFGVALLAASIAIGMALRVWVSFHDDGIYWPDEIYESLEPAHRLVFGQGLISWEFIEGARNWTLPGFVAALLRLCAVLGLDDPRQYLSFVRVVMSAVGAATAYGSYLLARRLGTSPLFAACGAAFFALIGPAIYFAPRALAETASALPVVLGLAFALPPQATRRDRIIGTSLLGLATLLRLQNALFCGAQLCVLAARGRWREARQSAIVLAVWVLGFGLLDKLTWGEWFRSADIYVRFNLMLGGVPITGTSPASYYLQMSLAAMPLATFVVAALCLVGVRRAPGLAFVATAFLLAHMLTSIKMYRYILPALPLYGALAAVGLQELWSRAWQTTALLAASALLAAVIWSGATFHSLTFGDVGPYEKTRPTESAFDEWGPVNRLLIAASRRSDLCGLRVETDNLTWTGGYTYLHRRVPLYPPTGPPRDSGRYNYVIAAAGRDAGTVVSTDGNRVLGRLGNSTCTADPHYDPRLPGFEETHKALGF